MKSDMNGLRNKKRGFIILLFLLVGVFLINFSLAIDLPEDYTCADKWGSECDGGKGCNSLAIDYLEINPNTPEEEIKELMENECKCEGPIFCGYIEEMRGECVPGGYLPICPDKCTFIEDSDCGDGVIQNEQWRFFNIDGQEQCDFLWDDSFQSHESVRNSSYWYEQGCVPPYDTDENGDPFDEGGCAEKGTGEYECRGSDHGRIYYFPRPAGGCPKGTISEEKTITVCPPQEYGPAPCTLTNNPFEGSKCIEGIEFHDDTCDFGVIPPCQYGEVHLLVDDCTWECACHLNAEDEILPYANGVSVTPCSSKFRTYRNSFSHSAGLNENLDSCVLNLSLNRGYFMSASVAIDRLRVVDYNGNTIYSRGISDTVSLDKDNSYIERAYAINPIPVKEDIVALTCIFDLSNLKGDGDDNVCLDGCNAYGSYFGDLSSKCNVTCMGEKSVLIEPDSPDCYCKCSEGLTEISEDRCAKEEYTMSVGLNEKYKKETLQYRKFTPTHITPFDDVTCEFKVTPESYEVMTGLTSPAPSYGGKLMTGEGFSTEIVSKGFKYEGTEGEYYIYRMDIKGWSYDRSNNGLGNPIGWSTDESVLDEIVNSEKLQCKIKIDESEYKVDNTEADRFSQELTSCPTFLSLGDVSSDSETSLPFYIPGEFNSNRNDLNNFINLCLSQKKKIDCSPKLKSASSTKVIYGDLEESWYSWLDTQRKEIESASREFGVPAEIIASIGLLEFYQNRGDYSTIGSAMKVNSFWNFNWLGGSARKARLAVTEMSIVKSANDLVGYVPRIGSFGNMHSSFPQETMAIITDTMDKLPIPGGTLAHALPRVDATNNNLKNDPRFTRLIMDVRNAGSVKDFRKTKDGNIRLVAASLAVMGILWETDSNSMGSSIANRPEILGSIYNSGWVNKHGNAYFVPKPNPGSGGIKYVVVADGEPHSPENFGDRTKRVADSYKMKKFVSGEKSVECKISTDGGSK